MMPKDNDMMNKAVAFACRKIPYMPELRAYCKSVTACILMAQLEYRFASMPDGFYKFLSPCDHYAYKLKDSWTEELGFSEDEFRSAISHIAVRYLSKTRLQEAIDSGKDPFQGKCYLVYKDVTNSLTYYLRNHDVANDVIAEAISGYKPEAEQDTPQECFEKNQQSSQTGKSSPQKLAKPVSIPGKIPSPYIEHKMTTKEDSSSNELPSCEEQAIALNGTSFAAAAELSSNDLIIHTSPTALQMQHIQELAELYYHTYGVNKEVLVQQIIMTITNLSYFSHAGQDFFKKFNTLKKSMKDRKWTPPAETVLKLDKEKQKKINDIEYKVRMAQADIVGYDRSLNYGGDESYLEILRKNKIKKIEEIEKYQMELAKYQDKSIAV